MLFFCFVSIGSPVIQGYLIKTIPKSIKGIGVGLDIIISTFLGKIPGPVIYGALQDEYEEENPFLAWRICNSYFFVGVIITFILCFFKYKEVEIIKDADEVNEVNIKDSIVNIAAIGSGTDANMLLSLKMPVPKKAFRNKSMIYQFHVNDDDPERKSYLSTLLEKSERSSLAPDNKTIFRSCNNEIKNDYFTEENNENKNDNDKDNNNDNKDNNNDNKDEKV